MVCAGAVACLGTSGTHGRGVRL